MSRFRLVTVQNGREHVSSVVSGKDEMQRDLALEAELHRMAGWVVALGDENVVAIKGGVVRAIFFREYDAMGDV